jgi:hypothetical protein
MAFEKLSHDLGTLKLGQMVLIPLNVADLNNKKFTITLGCGSCTSFVQNEIENYNSSGNTHFLTNKGDVFNLTFIPNSLGLNSKTAVVHYKDNTNKEQVATIQWFANVVN